MQIIGRLSDAGLKIVGADVVEFTPIYDNAAETTGIAVAQIIYEILHWMVSDIKPTEIILVQEVQNLLKHFCLAGSCARQTKGLTRLTHIHIYIYIYPSAYNILSLRNT